MKHRPTSRRRRSSTKSVLRLLDLERSKTAVLNSLTSQDAQRGYRHLIDWASLILFRPPPWLAISIPPMCY